VWFLSISIGLQAQAGAQAGRGRGNQPPAAGRGNVPADAPFDPTGYWVSIVSDEWRYRMLTPPKGNIDYVPLNAEGRRVAQEWDPAKDEAAGEQCRAYGAAGVMRAPGRIHITWQDDETLKVETEAGTQTRLLHFGGASAADETQPSWQGASAAEWEFAGGRRGRGQGGDLKVVTRRMRPGYLQKNGVPYGINAVLSEYFARTMEPNGDSWLILTSVVEDPQYLTGRFVRSTHYKRLPDANPTWEPEPCSAR
jgi:hypothetical protein